MASRGFVISNQMMVGALTEDEDEVDHDGVVLAVVVEVAASTTPNRKQPIPHVDVDQATRSLRA